MSFCKVLHCRYKGSHATCEHICGKCGEKGHGILECNNYKKNELAKYYNIELPPDKWCAVIGCNRKKFHITEAHPCDLCGLFHTSNSDCLIKSIYENQIKYSSMDSQLSEYNLPFGCIELRKFDYYDFFRNYNNSFLNVNNCLNNSAVYFRKKNNILKSIAVIVDTFNIPLKLKEITILNNFIEDLENITDIYNNEKINVINEGQETKILCPICRKLNKKSKCLEMKGLSEKCKICYENEIEILFSECGHPCICKICLYQLQNT